MSIPQTVCVTVIRDDGKKETSILGSDSSSTDGLPWNSVSFVNITYDIQPKSFLARFKEVPAKRILNNVRLVWGVL